MAFVTLVAAVAVLSGLGRLAADQLVEIALGTAGGLILVEQRELAFVELLKPFLPGDVLQGVFSAVTRKVEPQHADIILAARAADTGRLCPAFFGPLADLLVIRQELR